MIYLTERQLAERKTDLIKDAVAKTGVDFCIRETPYSLCLTLKKKFVNDYSPKSSVPSPSPPDSTLSSPVSRIPFDSTLSSDLVFPSSVSSETSPFSPLHDSGISRGKCSTCETIEQKTEKELSDLKKKDKYLRKEIESKDASIIKLEQKLKHVEEEKNKIKSERDTKSDQLKQKNKALEKALSV